MKKSHKYKYGGRVFNWRVAVLSATVLWCATAGYYSSFDNTYVAEPQAFMAPIVVDHPQDESVETKIRKYFPRSHVTMIAIAHAESGLKNTAVNWNCYYNDDMTEVYTTRVKGSHGAACKKEHRKYAFGIDCFVLQAHYKGLKECPKDVTIDEHLQEMAELSKARGFQPWIAWQRNMHTKYLNN